MLSYFLEHNLDGIVDGSELQPAKPLSEKNNWILRQKKAAGFIARKLDSSNRDIFINAETRRDPQALWHAIQLKYASRTARNGWRLFTRFLSLRCPDGDLSKYTPSFREIIREMNNAGVKLDDDLLAHMALHHLPAEHHTTRQVIIATSESSNVALTLKGVLSQINELIEDGDTKTTSTSTALNTKSRQNYTRQSNYERCSNGSHNANTAHSAEECWQLHPNKNPYSSQSGTANMASISGRAVCAKAAKGNSSWKPILDTRTTQTMFQKQAVFAGYSPRKTIVKVANGDSIDGLGVGSVKATHRGSTLTFVNALHVPSIKMDLISMVELAIKGCSIVFKEDGKFEVLQDSDTVLSGNIVDGLMELDIEIGKYPSQIVTAHTTCTDGAILHSRLGHPGPVPYSKVHPNASPPDSCDACILAKHH